MSNMSVFGGALGLNAPHFPPNKDRIYCNLMFSHDILSCNFSPLIKVSPKLYKYLALTSP